MQDRMLTTQDGNVSVICRFSDEVAFARAARSSNSFLKTLVRKGKSNLTTDQWVWLHVRVNQAASKVWLNYNVGR